METTFNLEQRTSWSMEIKLEIKLPESSSSILSHKRNIIYCIKKINNEIKNNQFNKEFVIGYTLQRALGLKEVNYQLLTKEEAEGLKRENNSFGYLTLDELLVRKKEIDEGKYILDDGLIIDFNPVYKKRELKLIS